MSDLTSKTDDTTRSERAAKRHRISLVQELLQDEETDLEQRRLVAHPKGKDASVQVYKTV